MSALVPAGAGALAVLEETAKALALEGALSLARSGGSVVNRAGHSFFDYARRYGSRWGARAARKLLNPKRRSAGSRSSHSVTVGPSGMGKRGRNPFGALGRFPKRVKRSRSRPKKRRSQKRSMKRVKFHPKLQKRLRRLECKANQVTTKKIHRFVDYARMNETTFGLTTSASLNWNLTNVSSVLASCATFDNSAPGTPIYADLRDGTFARKICFEYMLSQCTIILLSVHGHESRFFTVDLLTFIVVLHGITESF